MSGGGDSRVSIPNNLRKVIQEIKNTLGSKHSEEFVYRTLKDCDMDPNEAGQRLQMIHDIREIAGKHSVEDVYTMLIDCNMDPNEAAQKLLYIDTFHEVKKKRDRGKTISSDTSEEYRRARGNQWRGAKGGRGTSHSLEVFDDVGGGRTLSSGKEYGVANRSERGSRLTMPVHSGKENNIAHVVNSASNVNSKLSISNGSYSHKHTPKPSADDSSSTSDPVVGPSQNFQDTCAVGTIKCENVKCSGSSESNDRLPARMHSSGDQVVANTIPVIAEDADSYKRRQLKSDVVEKNEIAESLQPSLWLTQKTSQVVNPNQDNQPQLSNMPLKVTASKQMTLSITNSHSIPGKESELKGSAPKLDLMLEKLTLSSHRPVIFPDHLQVPETFKSQFKFGSLDAAPDDCRSLAVTESTQQNNVVVTEPSLSNQDVGTTAQESEFQGHSLPHLSENVLTSQDNISSDPALKHEQTKLETVPSVGGFQNPVLQPTRDYSFGLMPHLVGPHFVQLDVPELQGGSSPLSTSKMGPTPASQPAMAGQSSIALSPPVFPYFRQAYPNYIPYNPYFPHMYLPQNAHLLNHGVFPQQPPTGNVYVQAAAAAAGVKFPVPSQYKQGNNAVGLMHLGIPSGYGSYGSSVGYGAAVTPGSSASEDLTASQTKDNNLYTAVQQCEDPQVWAPAAGRELPNLQPNYFYNFPLGQHMAFSPLQAGLYHSSQTMAAQSTIRPLMHQSQSTGGMIEPMVPPSSSYQQPQHAAQINWNTALLNRETN